MSRDLIGRPAELWGFVDGKDNPVSIDALATWMTVGPASKEYFEEALAAVLPRGSHFFGGRQNYTDGKQRYVALLRSDEYQYWPNHADRFEEVGGAYLIDFLTPLSGRVEEPKLSMVKGYCAKDGDTFEHRWSSSAPDGGRQEIVGAVEALQAAVEEMHASLKRQ